MKVEDYLALEPRRFSWLERMEVRAAGSGFDLELEFRDESSGRLVVVCEGVRDLVFKQPWTTDMRLHALEVTDVRSRQMEGVAYSVSDLEQESLSFTAATFSAQVRG
jgi:hypothetical protein